MTLPIYPQIEVMPTAKLDLQRFGCSFTESKEEIFLCVANASSTWRSVNPLVPSLSYVRFICADGVWLSLLVCRKTVRRNGIDFAMLLIMEAQKYGVSGVRHHDLSDYTRIAEIGDAYLSYVAKAM